MDPRKKSIAIRTAVLAVATILLIVGIIGAFQPRPQQIEVKDLSYSESVSFTVKDVLFPNMLYGNTTLINPPAIFTNITKAINTTFRVTLSQTSMHSNEIFVSQKMSLKSADPIWSKVLYSNSTSEQINSSGYSKTFQMQSNYSSYVTMAKKIDGQLNGPYSDPTLVLNVTVTPAGLKSVTSGISILLSPIAYSINYLDQNSTEGTLSHQSTTNVSLVLPITTYESYAFAAAGVALSGYLVFVMFPRNPDPIRRYLKDRFDDVIEIDRYINESAIMLERKEDIFKIAEMLELPIFLNRNERILFVENDRTQYYVELKT